MATSQLNISTVSNSATNESNIETTQSDSAEYSNLSTARSKVPAELQDELMEYILEELIEFTKQFKSV